MRRAYSRAPSPWTSVATVTSPVSCSGAMYAGVPATHRPASGPSASRTASPKSATYGRPASSSRMLAGFRSRCSTPRWWAKWTARATRSTSSAARSGWRAYSASLPSTDPTGYHSRLKNGGPSPRDTSRMRATCGWSQPGHRLGLGPKPVAVRRPGPQEHLDRHLPRQAPLPGPVDQAHVPAEPFQQLVIADEPFVGPQVRLPRPAAAERPEQFDFLRLVQELPELVGQVRVPGQPVGRRDRAAGVAGRQVLANGRGRRVVLVRRVKGGRAHDSTPAPRSSRNRLFPRNKSPATPFSDRFNRPAVSASDSPSR